MYVYVRLFLDNSMKVGELPEGMEIKKGDYLVVETKLGLDLAKSLSDVVEVLPEGVKSTLKIVSKATEEHLKNFRENEDRSKQNYDKVKSILKKHLPNINFLKIHFVLDKSKVVIYYTSEERVDFREAVKELASLFRTRIEMRQVSSREAFRMMGGIGICGMECCCSRFDVKNDHISASLVKEQSLSEVNAKLIGPCGKLLCCLSYERENYKDGKCLICKSAQNNYQENGYVWIAE
jgi:cell fate regulator YaaT (PSP1 superfamily)